MQCAGMTTHSHGQVQGGHFVLLRSDGHGWLEDGTQGEQEGDGLIGVVGDVFLGEESRPKSNKKCVTVIRCVFHTHKQGEPVSPVGVRSLLYHHWFGPVLDDLLGVLDVKEPELSVHRCPC